MAEQLDAGGSGGGSDSEAAAAAEEEAESASTGTTSSSGGGGSSGGALASGEGETTTAPADSGSAATADADDSGAVSTGASDGGSLTEGATDTSPATRSIAAEDAAQVGRNVRAGDTTEPLADEPTLTAGEDDERVRPRDEETPDEPEPGRGDAGRLTGGGDGEQLTPDEAERAGRRAREEASGPSGDEQGIEEGGGPDGRFTVTVAVPGGGTNTFTGSAEFIAGKLEQAFLLDNPGMDASDVRVVETDEGRLELELTESGERRAAVEAFRRRLDQLFGGSDVDLGPEDVERTDEGFQLIDSAVEQLGQAQRRFQLRLAGLGDAAGRFDVNRAASQAGFELRQRLGAALALTERDPGARPTRDIGGLTPATGPVVEPTGQTALDRRIEQFERDTGLDLIPGEGDVVQGTEAFLQRQAEIHRQGRGLLPSGEQAADITESLFPVFDPAAPQSRFVAGQARRLGEIANPAAIALGLGTIGEQAGEFTFNTAVAAFGPDLDEVRSFEQLTGEQAPADVVELAEVQDVFETRREAQASAAGAAGAFLASETVTSFRERPVETLGSAGAEVAVAIGAADASPLRVSRARIPLQTGETATLRSLRFQTPRVAERLGITPRGRSLAGLRTGGGRVRPSIGPPGIQLERVAFRELPGEGAAFEPVSALETEALLGRGLQREARRASTGRRAVERTEAIQDVIDIGARRRRGRMTDPTTEGVVRNVQRVPQDRVQAVARALEDLDATVEGSAAIRAQLPEARAPRDLDILVDDEAAARARLGEALEGADADVDDVFDIKERGERAAPGQTMKFGRRAQPRLRTEGGVRVTSLSEELIRKAGAAGFIRGSGTPTLQFRGLSEVIDIGPEPVRLAKRPRFKDVGDTATIARGLVQGDLRSGLPFLTLRSRTARREARAIERFEDLFAGELREPDAITGDVPLEAPTARGAVAEDLRRAFTGVDRGQVTLAAPARSAGRRSLGDVGDNLLSRLERLRRDVDRSPASSGVTTTRRLPVALGGSPPSGGQAPESPFASPAPSGGSPGGSAGPSPGSPSPLLSPSPGESPPPSPWSPSPGPSPVVSPPGGPSGGPSPGPSPGRPPIVPPEVPPPPVEVPPPPPPRLLDIDLTADAEPASPNRGVSFVDRTFHFEFRDPLAPIPGMEPVDGDRRDDELVDPFGAAGAGTAALELLAGGSSEGDGADLGRLFGL